MVCLVLLVFEFLDFERLMEREWIIPELLAFSWLVKKDLIEVD